MADRSRPEFTLTFDGPALADARMAVGDLAPALLALGEVFHEVNAIAYPGGPPVRLEIRALNQGSFAIDLTLVHQAASTMVNFFNSRDGVALSSLVGTVGGAAGLFTAIVAIGKRIVGKTENQGDRTVITFTDGTTLDIPSDVAAVVERTTIRRSARKVVQPLHVEGIDQLRFSVGGRVTTTIAKADAGIFDIEPVPEAPHEQSITMALRITTLSFAAGNKWKLNDGQRDIWAVIDDEHFLERIESGDETFAKGDVLRCDMRLHQWRTDEGLRTEWRIARVIEHVARTEPLRLPFD